MCLHDINNSNFEMDANHGRVLSTEEIDWDQQTAHFYQYEDGMELVQDEEGNVTPESVNIKLYAETQR